MSGMGFTIALFGASGATGLEVAVAAASRGWQVNGLVRRPGSLSRIASGAREVVGSLEAREIVLATVTGAHAIIIAIGPRPPYQDVFCASATESILRAGREAGVRRVVCLTGALVGDYPQNQGKLFQLLGRLFARKREAAARDRVVQEALVRQSGLEWTIVKPPRLTDGPRTGRVRAGQEVRVGLSSRISRKDLADVLLDLCVDEDAVEAILFVKGA